MAQTGVKATSDSDEKALKAAAESYSKNGNEAFRSKDYSNAVHFYTEGIKVNCKDEDLEAELYSNRAAAYFNLGNYIDSLKDAKGAFDIRPLSVKAIVTGASASAKLNLFEQANAWCNAGMAIDKTNTRLLELSKLVAVFADGANIVSGTPAKDNEDLNNLLSELELGEAKEAEDRDGESKGSAYDHLGSVYRSLGDFQKAIEFHQQALGIAKEIKDKGSERTAYDNLGLAYRAFGRFRKAVEFHQQALGIAKEIGDKDSERKAYVNLGVAYLSLGDFKKAIEFHNQALSIARETGDKNSEELILMYLGVASYSSHDFSKAKELFKSSPKLSEEMEDTMQVEDEWIDEDNPPPNYNKAPRFLWRLYLRQGKTMEALLTADRGRAQALMDHMESRYGVESSRLSPEKQTEGISSLFSHISSPSLFLAEAAKSLNFWVLLKGQQCLFLRRELHQNLQYLTEEAYLQIGFTKQPKIEDRSMDGPEEDADVEQLFSLDFKKHPNTEALKTLYDAVIAPISHLIQGEELIVVGDRLSLLIPYAVLEDQHSRYLSETLRIRLAPSLTSLRLLAECPEGRHSTSGALLVGDPWVENIRFKEKTFNQLPGAEEEVKIIGRILNIEPLTGTNATKEQVLSKLPSVSLVHFATHSRKGSGEMFLTPNRSRYRPDTEDFLLTIEDVLKVKMHAKLVVLSYSNSARGKKTTDECVLGIAHAFLAAGARCVIGSLWPINDKATVQLMKHFYENLAAGKSASKSLNSAMTWMRETNNYSDPKFWGPFVLIGDDVTLNFDK